MDYIKYLMTFKALKVSTYYIVEENKIYYTLNLYTKMISHHHCPQKKGKAT